MAMFLTEIRPWYQPPFTVKRISAPSRSPATLVHLLSHGPGCILTVSPGWARFRDVPLDFERSKRICLSSPYLEGRLAVKLWGCRLLGEDLVDIDPWSTAWSVVMVTWRPV